MDVVMAFKAQQTKVYVAGKALSHRFIVPPIKDFSNSLIMGVTRGYCLGRSHSQVSFSISLYDDNLVTDQSNVKIEPLIFKSKRNYFSPEEDYAEEDDRLWLATKTTKLEINFYFEEFHLGRDGSVCVFANQHLVTCILQPQLELDLLIEKEEIETILNQNNDKDAEETKDYDIAFSCELRSSMYADVLSKSNSITLRLQTTSSTLPSHSTHPIQTNDDNNKKDDVRRSLPYSFKVSQYADRHLTYLNQFDTNEPIIIILDENTIIPLHFTISDWQ
mmetsp:Transcript_31635/g.40658  ORF Transcript_31635/g.40658 Transcript_31635/m.40658 type:complete len:276 (+) Transcript_31635:887-1714(+)